MKHLTLADDDKIVTKIQLPRTFDVSDLDSAKESELGTRFKNLTLLSEKLAEEAERLLFALEDEIHKEVIKPLDAALEEREIEEGGIFRTSCVLWGVKTSAFVVSINFSFEPFVDKVLKYDFSWPEYYEFKSLTPEQKIEFYKKNKMLDPPCEL